MEPLLADCAASGTGEHQHIVGVAIRVVVLAADHEGVQAVDAMHQTRLDQEIEGSVDGHRRRPTVRDPHVILQVIGLGRAAALQQQAQHLPTQGGQLRAMGSAVRGRGVKLAVKGRWTPRGRPRCRGGGGGARQGSYLWCDRPTV